MDTPIVDTSFMPPMSRKQRELFNRLQISDPRKSARRKGRAGRMIKSNFGKVATARNKWPRWLERFGGKRKVQKFQANVIPATLRPWVPANRAILSGNDEDAKGMYRAALRAACTFEQFDSIRASF